MRFAAYGFIAGRPHPGTATVAFHGASPTRLARRSAQVCNSWADITPADQRPNCSAVMPRYSGSERTSSDSCHRSVKHSTTSSSGFITTPPSMRFRRLHHRGDVVGQPRVRDGLKVRTAQRITPTLEETGLGVRDVHSVVPSRKQAVRVAFTADPRTSRPAQILTPHRSPPRPRTGARPAVPRRATTPAHGPCPTSRRRSTRPCGPTASATHARHGHCCRQATS